jgi:ribosomal protein S18 acetylase RimI-like enzyme
VTVDVRTAAPAEAPLVAAILADAAAWLERRGTPMWRLDELEAARIAEDVTRGNTALAWCGGEAAGTVRFQLEDPIFWPDLPDPGAAYIHRLAVLRRYAGGAVSTALLGWAVEQARGAGRRVLRLDCERDRTRLRAVYERFGFRWHSERPVGPYLVARYEYPVASSP